MVGVFVVVLIVGVVEDIIVGASGVFVVSAGMCCMSHKASGM